MEQPPKFKLGDAVQWVGNKPRGVVLAEGLIGNLPVSGTRYEVVITKAIDPKLQAARYFVESVKLKLMPTVAESAAVAEPVES